MHTSSVQQRTSRSPPGSQATSALETVLDLPTIHPRQTKEHIRATHDVSASFYLGGTLGAVLLTCTLLDATSFFLHLSVYLAFVASACVGHRYVSARVHGGRPAVALAYVVLALLWPWPGLLCFALATLAIIGVCDVIALALVPGTMLVALSWLVLLVVASTVSPWMACVLGGAAVSVGHRRQLLVLAPIVHGTFLAIASAVGLLLFGVLVVLSMNPFWLATNEVSKYDALRYLGRDASLDATRIASLDDLAVWHAAAPRSFPIVIKPNVCTTSSAGVRLCRDYACLETYIRERQATGSRQDDTSWVLQKAAYGLEAVVFFYRYPYADAGNIKSIGLRDASRTEGVDGNDLRANYFTSDGNRLRTDAFLAYFRNITAHFDGYTGGRFDVILESEEAAMEGRGIGVVDANIFPLGDIEEKQDTWSAKVRALRTLGLQFWMGYSTVLGGYQAKPWVVAHNIPRLVERYYQCQNHENLYAVP